jgi:TRAP-type C4-dicarboxylate transport system permease small subunit
VTAEERAALSRRETPLREERRLSAALLEAPRQIVRFFDHLATAMAYVSGAVLLLVSFYITADVIGRKFFHVSSAVTDEYGGYALALGGMWALAFALTTGKHVRIDVLLPHLPQWLQSLLNYAALLMMALFASIVAFYLWKLAIDSFVVDARAMSFLRTPLFVPQGFMALGFSLLGVHAIVIFVVGIFESLRIGRLANLPMLHVADLTEGL